MNKSFLKTAIIIVLVIECIIFTLFFYWFLFTTVVPLTSQDSDYITEQRYQNCNIAVIPILGDIIPYRGANMDGTTYIENMPPTVNLEDTLLAIEDAENDPNITGMLFRIDSGGGTPVTALTIASAIKKSTLPNAALITELGASGAYLIATGADTIIASPFSDVGSIGITMSYLDNSVQNETNGLRFVSLASGKFKDSGISDKPLSDEERSLFERDIALYHTEFVNEVAQNRNLPIEEVQRLADGSTFPGKLALENKLIDSLGDIETARNWFALKTETPATEIAFCYY